MRGRDDVRPRRMDLGVDQRKRGRIHRPVAVDDLATIVDEDEVLHSDLFEVHPEWVGLVEDNHEAASGRPSRH